MLLLLFYILFYFNFCAAALVSEAWIEEEWRLRSSGSTRERNSRVPALLRSAYSPVCSRGSRALDAGRVSYAAGELSLCAPSGAAAAGYAGYAHYVQGNFATAARLFDKMGDGEETRQLENIARDARVRAALAVPGAVRRRGEPAVGAGGVPVEVDELPAMAVEPEYWRYLGEDPARLPEPDRNEVLERSCSLAAAETHPAGLKEAALSAFRAVSARLNLPALRVLEVQPCAGFWPRVLSARTTLPPTKLPLPVTAADVIVALDFAEGLTDAELLHFVGAARKQAKRLILATRTNLHSTQPKRLLRTERHTKRDLLSLLPDPITITPIQQHNIAIIVY